MNDSKLPLTPPLTELMQDYRQKVDKALDQVLKNTSNIAVELHQAMRYSTFNGGKRIRPLLVYLTGKALNCPAEHLDAPACAVELIHCYSLVHDDMPAMDDDDLRRGKATCHKQFSEAIALLAGDALQTLAFETLTHNNHLQDSQILQMIRALTQASGAAGMAGGQAIDLAATGSQVMSLDNLKIMHEHKTGDLIRASVQLGALSLINIDKNKLSALDHYAKNIGLSFQIKDDILDIESDTETLGKQQGADIELNKVTYPSLLGLDGAKKMAQECHQKALQSLKNFDHNADPLRSLSEYIITRQH
ncbi:MAG: (2E,6E)-farnesyl diphosphate synthase [gamma proteobacterium symbiont of Taylorina sp.]|nr:(2E,6E)-farnesyl diphosphate synthase [gamma proteobacterium symbiont of Taylorina sp.]